MEVHTDSMTDKIANHGETSSLHDFLDRMSDVAEMILGCRLLNSGVQGFSRDAEQPLGFL
jgi:hypothetical protein